MSALGGLKASDAALTRIETLQIPQSIQEDGLVGVRTYAVVRAELAVAFERQSVRLAKLDHPNVAAVASASAADGIHARATPVTGTTLDAFLEQGRPVSPGAVMALAKGMADGLAAAHGVGVLHLNLSPEAVDVTPRGGSLIRFGIDKRPLIPFKIKNLYSRQYSPVEQQLKGGTPLTQATDVYGLCAVLFRLIAGRPPEPWYDHAANREALAGRDYPAAFLAGVAAGLHQEASDRPQSMEAWLKLACPQVGGDWFETQPAPQQIGPSPEPPPRQETKATTFSGRSQGSRPWTRHLPIALAICAAVGAVAWGVHSVGWPPSREAARPTLASPDAAAPAHQAPQDCVWESTGASTQQLVCAIAGRPTIWPGLNPGDVEAAADRDPNAMLRLGQALLALSAARGNRPPDEALALLKGAYDEGSTDAGLVLAAALGGPDRSQQERLEAEAVYQHLAELPLSENLRARLQAGQAVLRPVLYEAPFAGSWRLSDQECSASTRLAVEGDAVRFLGINTDILAREGGVLTVRPTGVEEVMNHRMTLQTDAEDRLTVRYYSSPEDLAVNAVRSAEVYSRCAA